MLPRNHPDRIQIAFDDHRLVANAGLILPATLALRLGLPQLLRKHLDLGGAPGRANTGDKMMTLVASALAGGDCIDDADVLRAGGTARVLGFTAKAPSTLGTFLRSFRWGHVRQLDRVSRELLARVWKAGAGPGDAPFTIDLDSTICETYGLAKEGARHHGYTGARGYHPLLAVAAGTGDVLMARLREPTPPGAAHKALAEPGANFPQIKEWFGQLDPDQRTAAGRLFGRINQLPIDDPNHKRQLFMSGILAFESLKLRNPPANPTSAVSAG